VLIDCGKRIQISDLFLRHFSIVLVQISTASSGGAGSQCGFGWKAKLLASVQSFFSHHHQICGLLLHRLWTHLHRCSSLLARYPKLPQASATTTVFI
jgi:hypothetical protein